MFPSPRTTVRPGGSRLTRGRGAGTAGTCALQIKGEQLMLLSIRRAAAVGLGLGLAATALWASGEEEAAAEAEFVDVELTKLDGTTMTRRVRETPLRRHDHHEPRDPAGFVMHSNWDPKRRWRTARAGESSSLLNQKPHAAGLGSHGPSGTGDYAVRQYTAGEPTSLYAVPNAGGELGVHHPTTTSMRVQDSREASTSGRKRT